VVEGLLVVYAQIESCMSKHIDSRMFLDPLDCRCMNCPPRVFAPFFLWTSFGKVVDKTLPSSVVLVESSNLWFERNTHGQPI
jgi:hypothetical protein